MSAWDEIPEAMRSRDLQRVLQLPQTTVSLWLTRGTIPAHRISHSWIAFRCDVRSWLEATAVPPARPRGRYPHPLDSYGDEISARELAELLRVSKQAVAGWLRDGLLPAERDERRWIIAKPAVAELLRLTSNQRSPTTASTAPEAMGS